MTNLLSFKHFQRTIVKNAKYALCKEAINETTKGKAEGGYNQAWVTKTFWSVKSISSNGAHVTKCDECDET